MLQALRVALVAKFDTFPDLTAAAPGKLNSHPAIQGTELPHFTYQIIDSIPIYSIGGGPRIENVRIQFSAWTDDPKIATTDALIALFISHWDDVELTVTGFNPFLFERRAIVPFFDETLEGRGAHIDYMMMM